MELMVPYKAFPDASIKICLELDSSSNGVIQSLTKVIAVCA